MIYKFSVVVVVGNVGFVENRLSFTVVRIFCRFCVCFARKIALSWLESIFYDAGFRFFSVDSHWKEKQFF